MEHGDYTISFDPDRVDVDVVFEYLHDHSYWAAGRARDVVGTSIANSALVVGAYTSNGVLVGFARMVTDLATFAWLCDVFVLDKHRGHGLGVTLVDAIVTHPSVAGVKRQLLATRDAHDLYRRSGFETLPEPEKWMALTGGGK